MSARSPRGQSVVETVLFLLVFVTIVTFGLHFAELGWLSLKTVEAANSALWDTTSKRMHDVTAFDFTLYRRAIAQAGPEATERYRDFDGRASVERAGDVVAVFTRTQPIEVRCENATAEDFVTLQAMDLMQAAFAPLETGMSCTARAVISGYRFPRWLLQQDAGGFFKTAQRRGDYGVCAAGKNGTRCKGRFSIALDDWGFSGGKERRECALAPDGKSTCANQGYFDLAFKGYKALVNARGDAFDTASTSLAKSIVGRSPLEEQSRLAENHFSLSFRGSESGYTEDLGVSHGDTQWETTPFKARSEYRAFSGPRADCWLGKPCN
jgi:hypothetical protein